jgi:uncharacterized RDD family membrane protein YckC
MPVSGPGGLEIGSLQRRALAALIDAALFVPPVMLAGGGGVWLYMAWRRRRSGGDDDDFDFAERVPFRRLAEPRWQLAMWVATAPLDIALRNWRSPGARAMGLRRVDARTGGPVSVRSALIHKAVEAASRVLNQRAHRPFYRRLTERRDAIQADMREARRAHADDPEARERAVAEVQRRHDIRPWGCCAMGLLGLLPRYLPALWSPRNQTLPERVAGTIVVVERGR